MTGSTIHDFTRCMERKRERQTDRQRERDKSRQVFSAVVVAVAAAAVVVVSFLTSLPSGIILKRKSFSCWFARLASSAPSVLQAFCASAQVLGVVWVT